MLTYDVERARRAVQYLVTYSYGKSKIRKLRNVVTLPRSMPFKGEEEVLNELLVIGRQCELAMENLIALALHKRPEPNEVSAVTMSQRRRREAIAINYLRVMTGVKFTLDEAKEKASQLQSQWQQEKVVYIKQKLIEHRIAHDKEMAAVGRNYTLSQAFWGMKDEELARMKDETRRILEQRAANKSRLTVVRAKDETSLEEKKRILSMR